MEQIQIVHLASGKNAYRWTHNEKPGINHWYQLRMNTDKWKIVKDFYSSALNMTLYKIVTYYNSDIIYSGKTLSQAREIIRDHTYRMVI